MKRKTISAFIINLFLATGLTTAYATEMFAVKDEHTVIITCMTQQVKTKVPTIQQTRISQCVLADANLASKCLGISTNDYTRIVKSCFTKLQNDKCVSAKLNLPLLKYASCGNGSNPGDCYQQFGYTSDMITKLSRDCQKENAR